MSKFLPKKPVKGEPELAWNVVGGGVWIPMSKRYSLERYGNFRMTLAVPEDEMKLGMER